jgi:hypothetical protein
MAQNIATLVVTGLATIENLVFTSLLTAWLVSNSTFTYIAYGVTLFTFTSTSFTVSDISNQTSTLTPSGLSIVEDDILANRTTVLTPSGMTVAYGTLSTCSITNAEVSVADSVGDSVLMNSGAVQCSTTGYTAVLTPSGLSLVNGANYSNYEPATITQDSGAQNTSITPGQINLSDSLADYYMVIAASYIIYEYYYGSTTIQTAMGTYNFVAQAIVSSVVQASLTMTSTNLAAFNLLGTSVLAPIGLTTTSGSYSSTLTADTFTITDGTSSTLVQPTEITTPALVTPAATITNLDVTSSASLGGLVMSVPTVQGCVTLTWNPSISDYQVYSAEGYASGATYSTSTGRVSITVPVGLITDYRKLIVRGRGWQTVTSGTYFINEVYLQVSLLDFTSFYNISFNFYVVNVSTGVPVALSSTGYMVIEYLWRA